MAPFITHFIVLECKLHKANDVLLTPTLTVWETACATQYVLNEQFFHGWILNFFGLYAYSCKPGEDEITFYFFPSFSPLLISLPCYCSRCHQRPACIALPHWEVRLQTVLVYSSASFGFCLQVFSRHRRLLSLLEVLQTVRSPRGDHLSVKDRNWQITIPDSLLLSGIIPRCILQFLRRNRTPVICNGFSPINAYLWLSYVPYLRSLRYHPISWGHFLNKLYTPKSLYQGLLWGNLN